jgi:hypothetical protein
MGEWVAQWAETGMGHRGHCTGEGLQRQVGLEHVLRVMSCRLLHIGLHHHANCDCILQQRLCVRVGMLGDMC